MIIWDFVFTLSSGLAKIFNNRSSRQRYTFIAITSTNLSWCFFIPALPWNFPSSFCAPFPPCRTWWPQRPYSSSPVRKRSPVDRTFHRIRHMRKWLKRDDHWPNRNFFMNGQYVRSLCWEWTGQEEASVVQEMTNQKLSCPGWSKSYRSEALIWKERQKHSLARKLPNKGFLVIKERPIRSFGSHWPISSFYLAAIDQSGAAFLSALHCHRHRQFAGDVIRNLKKEYYVKSRKKRRCYPFFKYFMIF